MDEIEETFTLISSDDIKFEGLNKDWLVSLPTDTPLKVLSENMENDTIKVDGVKGDELKLILDHLKAVNWKPQGRSENGGI